MRIKILFVLSCVFLLTSCKRTNLNKYYIKNIALKIFSLKNTNEIYYKADSILVEDKNKKYLILLIVNKAFVSINPHKGGYPNEGMDGMADSIISSNINLKSVENICIKTNISNLCNYSNKKIVKSSYSDEVCNDKNIDFDKFIEYYNNEIDETYSSEKYFIPFVVDYDEYKKFKNTKRFIKTKSNNKIKTLYLRNELN